MDHLFNDGVADVSFVNGLVRIDFFRFAQGTETEGDQKRPRRELDHRLVLSPEAFVPVQSAMAQMTKRLVDRGVLKPRTDEAKGKADKKKPAAKK
ncbi:MAG: hypothetical protein EXQ85_06950 [Alphaproteobacteria bacterium]|nr:hypothetical protein [Alphaproteobacteria bacterium]